MAEIPAIPKAADEWPMTTLYEYSIDSEMEPVVDRLNGVEGLSLRLHGLPSPYWGQEQVVTGLLTGSDLLAGLAGQELGDELLLPLLMLRQGEPVFLDDLSLEDLQQRLSAPIRLVQGADDFVAACLGSQAPAL